MDLNEVFMRRKSCRSFRKFQMPKEDVAEIYSITRLAPHASGGPRCMIYSFVDDNQLEMLKSICCRQEYVNQCSVVFVVCGKTEDKLRSGHAKYLYDCIISTTYMDLKAVSLGYQTCWIGNFWPDQRLIGMLPSSERDCIPVIMLLVGKEK